VALGRQQGGQCLDLLQRHVAMGKARLVATSGWAQFKLQRHQAAAAAGLIRCDTVQQRACPQKTAACLTRSKDAPIGRMPGGLRVLAQGFGIFASRQQLAHPGHGAGHHLGNAVLGAAVVEV
jgi:hypothetical protein